MNIVDTLLYIAFGILIIVCYDLIHYHNEDDNGAVFVKAPWWLVLIAIGVWPITLAIMAIDLAYGVDEE